MSIADFFKDLFGSRVTGVKIAAKGKGYSAQARVKGKIAGGFNKAVSGGAAKAKGVAGGSGRSGGAGQGGGQGGGPQGPAGAPAGKGKKMGFRFWGKKSDGVTPAMSDDEALDAKTQAINIGQFEEAQFRPCVGWVVIMSGVQKGRDFRLVAGRNRIGTDADMEVVLTDPYVSAHHATIVYTDEGIYQISDAGSTNGTRVNGKRIMQAQIVDNDSLQIGHVDLRFKALD
jgi:hypothetical protein